MVDMPYNQTKRKWLSSSIWTTDWTLTGITAPGQSESESNRNKRLFHTPQSFRTETLPFNSLLSYSD